MQNFSTPPSAAGNPSPPRRCYSCRVLISVFFGAIILLAIAAYAAVDISVPKLPHFRVDSLSLTNFSSSKSVTGTWRIRFIVQNRNKNLAVNYNALQSKIYYDNACLSESQHGAFKQGSMSETTLDVMFSAVDAYAEPFFLEGINREREGGFVGFDVQVVASIWFGPGSTSLLSFFSSRVLHVLCSTVLVAISSNSSSGNLVGGARECYTP